MEYSKVSFDGCKAEATSASVGAAVYVTGESVAVLSEYAWINVVGGYLSDNQYLYWGYVSTQETKPELNASLLHLVYNPNLESKTDHIRVDSALGWDLSTCGWSDLPCATMKFGVASSYNTTLGENQAQYYPVDLLAKAHSAEATTIEIDKSISIKGHENLDVSGVPTTTKYLAPMDSPLISVKQAEPSVECRLSKMTMKAEDAANGVTLRSNLIECSSGKLKMSGMRFMSINMIGCSLISVNSRECGGFEMSMEEYVDSEGKNEEMRCVYDGISRDSGSGSVFEVRVGNDGYVDLSNGEFCDCYGGESDGMSGGIYVKVEGEVKEFTMKNDKFSGGYDSSKLYSRYIYIDCIDGTRFLFEDLWRGTDYESEKASMWVKESTEERNAMEESVYYFLTKASSPIYVSESGADIESCGWKEFACKSIWYGYSLNCKASEIRLIGSETQDGEREVNVMDRGCMIIGNWVEREGGEEKISTKTVSKILSGGMSDEKGIFYICCGNGNSVSFSKIIFSISQYDIGRYIFDGYSGILSLNEIEVQGSSVVGREDQSFSSVHISEGVTKTTISSSTFSDLHLKASDGAAIHATLGDSSTLLISGSCDLPCTFTQCTATNGGAIRLAFAGQATATLSHTVFLQCSASNQGGAIYADLGETG